jgi:hypothetical protein
MERIVHHATRSKGIQKAPITGAGNVPLAVRQLKSAGGWNFKTSGCKLPPVYSSSNGGSSSESEDGSLASESSDDNLTTGILPMESYSRYIGETAGIRELFNEAAICGNCKKGKLIVTFESKCLSTTIHTKCDNCLAHSATPNVATGMKGNGCARNTEYATNVLIVLAQLLNGDGGTETGRIVGMLDLPNQSIAESAFPMIEYDLGEYIIPYTKELIQQNLVREVKMYGDTQPNFDFDKWHANYEKRSELLDVSEVPSLTVGYDMGWQKRSSGHRYDSHSGHAIPYGVLTRLPIGLTVLNKHCRVCTASPDPSEHDCLANFEGASGAMEASALIEVAHSLLDEGHVLFGTIVTDDDSSMRAQMKWSNADWMVNNASNEPPRVLTKGGKSCIRPDRGLLRRDYPEPTWLNDPSHRGKTLAGDLRSIEKQPKAISKGINKVDCIKVQSNFGCMIKQLKDAPESEWECKATCVLEHHFDNHEHCGSWCLRKLKSEKERDEDRRQPGKFYRCKVRDIVQYQLLKEIVSKYITLPKLKEVAHGYLTQLNESMNNTIAWLAQKNKTLSGSKSLGIRIHLGVGMQLVYLAHFADRIRDQYTLTKVIMFVAGASSVRNNCGNTVSLPLSVVKLAFPHAFSFLMSDPIAMLHTSFVQKTVVPSPSTLIHAIVIHPYCLSQLNRTYHIKVKDGLLERICCPVISLSNIWKCKCVDRRSSSPREAFDEHNQTILNRLFFIMSKRDNIVVRNSHCGSR